MPPRRSSQHSGRRQVRLESPVESSLFSGVRPPRLVNRCLFGRPDHEENRRWLDHCLAEMYNSMEAKWEIITPIYRKESTSNKEAHEPDYYLCRRKLPPTTPRKLKQFEHREMDFLAGSPSPKKHNSSNVLTLELHHVRFPESDLFDKEETPIKKASFDYNEVNQD